ncbi:hypothetical protein JHU04_002306 [Brenneria sp. 4F2]|nr:hypothetical protein [Brenneria bubanii]
MKLWLSGLALLAISAGAQAENYRIVQSASQKLDVWVDNIKDNTPKSWCTTELSLRIVANGDKKISVLESFMPRLGSLLESQCAMLNVVHWQFNKPDGSPIAQGNAAKANDWTPVIPPKAPQAQAPQQIRVEDLSPLADQTPWLKFSLKEGCYLRTFWQGASHASALFIPAAGEGKCDTGVWLNGRYDVTRLSADGEKQVAMTFVHGFPVIGLNKNADVKNLTVTSANNERMVISDGRLAQSWMILPYVSNLNSWQASGTVAVEVPLDQAVDDERLRLHLEEVRKVWSSRLEPGTNLTIVLVNALYPQLRDPAAGAYRTLK